MVKNNNSRVHHWWPVVLQRYWTDKKGDVSWINSNAEVQKKRAKNRQIGKTHRGHTMDKGSVWELNFEDIFSDVDNAIPDLLNVLQSLKPFGKTPREFVKLISISLRKEKKFKDICKFYELDDDVRRSLLLLIYSLLIRSPAKRLGYENYPKMFGLERDENVGKDNMFQCYSVAKKLCENSLNSDQFFVAIHSPPYSKPFLFGDGNLDWLTNNLVMNRIDGKTLVPLTPRLCVYFCTPPRGSSEPNFAAFTAAPWQVNQINDFVQIHSKNHLFFRGRKPKLMKEFEANQFLFYKDRSDMLIEMLDDIAGVKKPNSYFGYMPYLDGK